MQTMTRRRPRKDRLPIRPGPGVRWRRIVSPVGPLTLVVDDRGLVAIDMLDEEWSSKAQADGDISGALAALADCDTDDDVLSETANQLAAYFGGTLRTFDLPLHLEGTPFQLAVWRAVARIPYGETVSYADIARELGRPTAARTVGRTVGLNLLPIVVPCHRVVGSNGQLTGYASGLPVKARLLALERGAF